MSEEPRKPNERSPDADPEIPDLHLEERFHDLEALAKGIPTRIARRADAEIARRAPKLAPSTIRNRMRRRTVALLAMLGVMAAMASLWATLRQTSIIRSAIESQLADRFGAEVRLGDAEWDGWNSVTATDLVLRVPGWPERAAEVASIRRAMIVFDPLSLLAGKLSLVDLEVDGVVLRIVERADRPGQFNLFSLSPGATTGGGGQPRKAILRDLRLEFGVLRGEKAEWFGSQAYEATFDHAKDDPSRYAFRLSQREENDRLVAPGSGPRITGSWNERTFEYEATMEGLDLGPRARNFMPLNLRAWATRSNLSGQVTKARISGSAAQPLRSAEIDVRDVTLRERDMIRAVPWGRLVGAEVQPIGGDLALALPAGTVRLAGTSVTVEAHDARLSPGKQQSGAFEVPVDLTMSLDLDLGAQRPFDWDARQEWLDSALALAKFDLQVRLPGLDARSGPDGKPRPIELPMAAIDVLRDFGAADWAADVELRVSRGAADGAGKPAPVAMLGALRLRDGTIRASAFPYRLTGVQGTIEVDGARATITDLRGRGSGDGALTLSGTVDVGGKDPAYSIRAVGSSLVVDDRLIAAFDDAPRRIFGALFDRKAWGSLAAAGLAPPDSEPGGTLDLDLRVHQQAGGPSASVTGDVWFRDTRVVLDAFPNPITADGHVIIEDERVLLNPGDNRIRTHAGGTGTVTGTIGLRRAGNSRVVENDLRFEVRGEQLGATMLAAIPVSFRPGSPEPEGWPGKVRSPIADLLTALGVHAVLDIDGTVRTTPEGSDRVETHVRMVSGTITPEPTLPRVMRGFGLAWPGQLRLERLMGEIDVTPEGLTLRDFTAERDGGTVRADGRFSTDGEDGSLDVALKGFPIVRDFLGLAEGTDGDDARRAWDALQPSGTFDGTVHWRRTKGANATQAIAEPRTLTLGGTLPLQIESGRLVYRDGQISIEALDLRAPDTDLTPLRILAGGRLLGPDADFGAEVDAISIDSALVDSALRASGLESLRGIIRDWAIRGAFDAHYRIRGVGPDSPWRLTITPGAVQGVHAGRPFGMLVHGGTVEVEPPGVRAAGLVASIDEGWMTLDGELARGKGGTAGVLQFGAMLARWSPDAAAMLPLAAREALERIEFGTDAPIWTDGIKVTLDVPDDQEPRVEVRGRISMADAHFRAGTAFDGAFGTLDLAVGAGRGHPSGRIGLGFDQLKVIERVATRIHGELGFQAEDGTVRLKDLQGDMYGGRLMGSGLLDPALGYEVHVAFANVGFASFADAPADGIAPRTSGPQGTLRGKFDIRGIFGEPQSRRGTGRAAIADARMVEFPLGLSLLQLTQLMLPLSSALEQANIGFNLAGDEVRLTTLDLSTGTMRLEGGGKLDLRDGAIALRFRNRGQLPLLSDLYGVMADQFFVIDVGGTFRDPKPQLTPIPVLSPEPKIEHAPAPDREGAAPTPPPSTTQ